MSNSCIECGCRTFWNFITSGTFSNYFELSINFFRTSQLRFALPCNSSFVLIKWFKTSIRQFAKLVWSSVQPLHGRRLAALWGPPTSPRFLVLSAIWIVLCDIKRTVSVVEWNVKPRLTARTRWWWCRTVKSQDAAAAADCRWSISISLDLTCLLLIFTELSTPSLFMLTVPT